ncbi:MAG TPA: SRPBCC family protein [Longimicrobiales bacterium]|nr:SRPBCC family protein [Longimicrobiales bacterium]
MLDTGRTWLGGAAIGAGLMYLLDPQHGRRRRARVRDMVVHAQRQVDRAAGVASRDIEHRAKGKLAAAKSRLSRDMADDEVLRQRVRSEMGRIVSHPSAIEVLAEDGHVTLSGPILEHEMHDLLSAVRKTRGVRSVINRLEPHESAGRVSSLQGGKRRMGARPELLQTNWAPAPRVAAGLVGAAIAWRGATAVRGLGGAALACAGTALVLRALTNLPLRRLTGIGAGRRAVEIRKDINVAAPLDEVFEFWKHPENFPRFMSHIREVRRIGDRRWHWVAEGRGGIRTEWDAEITAYEPNSVIGWRSVEGATVQNAGIVRFQPNEDGGTRVTIQMTYNPPLGAVGHAVASVFGTDPRNLLHEDMVRFKSLMEEGRTSIHGRTVERDELRASA